MKNIQVLPTSQLTILHFDEALFISPNLQISKTINSDVEGRNIYIISDEEIKEGDWCLSKLNEVVRFGKKFTTSLYKKIILTTDRDLIKDGVQAIDDEFLEWFVKNPSCEYVEVSEDYFKPSNMVYGHDTEPYKIIIPKEEQKQHIIDMMKSDEELGLYEEPKQETTLEEVAERFYGEEEIVNDYDISGYLQSAFLTGAKWQQENTNINALNFEIDALKKQIKLLEHNQQIMYNKEDVILILMEYDYSLVNEGKLNSIGNIKKWFEQFKKK